MKPIGCGRITKTNVAHNRSKLDALAGDDEHLVLPWHLARYLAAPKTTIGKNLEERVVLSRLDILSKHDDVGLERRQRTRCFGRHAFLSGLVPYIPSK